MVQIDGGLGVDVFDAIGRAKEPGPGDVAIWNVRRLTGPRADKAEAQRAKLVRLIDRGAVVLLQATR